MSKFNFERNGPISIYPPIDSYSTHESKRVWDNNSTSSVFRNKNKAGIYVHIPFCPTRCSFCYYKSFSAGKSKMIEYTNSLLAEIELVSNLPGVQEQEFNSLYIGGGTPTFLPAHLLELIVQKITTSFSLSNKTEKCIEVRPGKEVTEEKLHALKSLDINRISIGVQSLNQLVLDKNGRKIDLALFYKIYEQLRSLGFDNINLDLLSGMPYDTFDSFRNTVNKIIQMAPENITCYKMHLFRNSYLYNEEDNKIHIPNCEEEIAMFDYFENQALNNDYIVDDIAYTYTKKNKVHVHRRDINIGHEFIGLGLSANAYFNNSVYQNTHIYSDYIEQLSKRQLPIKRAHVMNRDCMMKRAIIYGIRRSIINRDDFYKKFNEYPEEFIEREFNDLINDNIILITKNSLRLNPLYVKFSDDIARKYLLTKKERTKEKMLSDHKNISLIS